MYVSPTVPHLHHLSSFPNPGGVYHFDCNWTKATMGFVWVDGHMVCQDDYTYKPQAGSTDNPLPVNYFKGSSKGVVTSLPFRAHFYYDGVGGAPPPPPPPPPSPPVVCTAASVGVFDDHHHGCGFKEPSGDYSKTNSWENVRLFFWLVFIISHAFFFWFLTFKM